MARKVLSGKEIDGWDLTEPEIFPVDKSCLLNIRMHLDILNCVRDHKNCIIKRLAFLLLLLACAPVETTRQAPEWTAMRWWNQEIPSLASLQGKTVLVRWWTDGCEFCTASADALNNWHASLADSGLQVIGMYHPKPEPRPLEDNEVYDYIREKGFQFAVAEDADWTNLKRYWLDQGPKEYTSVSFLIDRKGRIRYIHPGGEYHRDSLPGHERCVQEYHALDSMIRLLIRERNLD
jgi:peroxiredoxin